jgi:hypothetical protein
MGNGLAARQFAPGALDIDVNPVVIVGRVRKQVDRRLIDDEPRAGAEALTDMRQHRGRAWEQHAKFSTWIV